MAKTVKLADLAGIMGVSTVTVSKALSGQKGVSEEMRRKIVELADDMGYKQPSVLRRQQQSQNFNIGVIISEIFIAKYDSFYWQIYQAITAQAISKNCFTMLEVISTASENAQEVPKLIQEHKVDGLVVIGLMSTPYLDRLKSESGIPVIYLDFYDQSSECDAVISNSFYGTYMLTNYLFEMGHRKIAFVGTLLATESITDRYFGYAKSMLEHGVEVPTEWVIEDRSIKTGRMNYFVDWEPMQNMPTAFVCNCDLTASYLIKRLEDKSFHVPEDVSVVGFDNYLFPGLSDIGITTYEVDMKDMAKRAVHNMIKKITNEAYKPCVTIIEGRMICKDSVSRNKN